MSEVEAKVARGGARAARRAARSAPLPDNIRPVRPGMSSGRYKPLVRCRRASHPSCRARCAREHRPRRRHSERHRIHDQGGRKAHAGRAAAFPARADRGHGCARGAALRAARSGSEARHGAVGLARVFRHRRRGGAHRRCQDRPVSRLDDQGSVRHRARRRHARASALLPAIGGLPRGRDADGDGHQHGLCQRVGHDQTRGHELGAAAACRGEPGDVPSDRRRRGQMAGTTVRQPIELLRRAAAQIRL